MTKVNHKPSTPAEKAIWAYLSKNEHVTHQDLKALFDVSDWERTNYLSKLKRLGILHDCARRGSTRVFTVLDQKAASNFAASRRNTLWGALWTVMRISGAFTQDDLIIAASSTRKDITPEKVRKYCAMLLRAGYLAVISKAKVGSNPARYRLVKDTGPLPPVIRNLECLVDPNEERAVYVQGGRQ